MNNPANVEPYVQLRLRQAESQRQFEHSEVAASERRARAEFDEADRIYRIKKQALIFAQINVKNSKLFQNLQSINNQCDRQAGAFPDSHLPHNFTQMMNQALIPPNDDDDVDSNDVNNIFSAEERKSLSTLNHSIAPSFYSIQPNLSTAPVNLSLTTTHAPASSYTSSSINTSTMRETRPIVSVPPMESASALLSVMSRWPSINKTYSMRWQPNRVGACPKHVLRKERCPGASCQLWHNIERDLSINPLPPSVINEMDTMEQQLIAMKEQKRMRRKSTGVKPEDGAPPTAAAATATPARKRARTESTGGDGVPNSANEHLPNLSDSPVVTTSLSKR